MFHKNLKFYRLRKQMTKRELADKINLTPMAITHYEEGTRRPSMNILKAMASVLEVRVSDFLVSRNEGLIFVHGEFRKNASLSLIQQTYIRESVEEYISRFMTVIEILGGDIIPDAPACHKLTIVHDDLDENAVKLRKHLGFAEDGPIEDLIGKLENKGIIIYECDIDNNKFSGMNGFVNGRPYIALNSNMNAERKRSTLAHELAHLMFIWPNDMDVKAVEQMATAISGAFLFPKKDAIRELGVSRTVITRDMLMIAMEYGISMWLLVKRAEICLIVTANVARKFYIKASKFGWRTAEPSHIEAEKPMLLSQLVYRAVNEGDITVQKGAELLKASYNDVVSMCQFIEE